MKFFFVIVGDFNLPEDRNNYTMAYRNDNRISLLSNSMIFRNKIINDIKSDFILFLIKTKIGKNSSS